MVTEVKKHLHNRINRKELKQRLRELLRLERLQVVRLFAKTLLQRADQANAARSSSNPGKTSERIFPVSVAQESSW